MAWKPLHCSTFRCNSCVTAAVAGLASFRTHCQGRMDSPTAPKGSPSSPQQGPAQPELLGAVYVLNKDSNWVRYHAVSESRRFQPSTVDKACRRYNSCVYIDAWDVLCRCCGEMHWQCSQTTRYEFAVLNLRLCATLSRTLPHPMMIFCILDCCCAENGAAHSGYAAGIQFIFRMTVGRPS